MEKKTIIAVIAFFAVLTAVLLLLIPVEEKNKRYEKWGSLAELAETNAMAEFIIENEELYTEDIIDMYYTNNEKLEFVYNYAFHKDDYATMTYTDAELNSDEIPALYMNDPRWAYEYIYDTTISENGCSSVAMTMVYLYLNRDSGADPVKFMEKAKSLDAVVGFDSVQAVHISEIAAAFNMKAEGVDCNVNGKLGVDHEALIEILDTEDTVLMVNMVAGTFGNHMLVIRGYCDEGYYINDPASPERTAQVWAFEDIEKEVGYYWKVTKK